MTNGNKKKKNKGNVAAPSSISSDMSDEETKPSSDLIITRANLEENLEALFLKHLEPIQKTIDETIKKLCSDIDNIKLIADNAFKLAQENQKVISQLRQENNALKNQLADNKNQHQLIGGEN